MKRLYLSLLLLLVICAAFSQAGKPDPMFGADGHVLIKFDHAAQLNSVAIQADGKIVAAGTADSDIALVRCNTDGTPDTSFGNNGKIKTDIGGYDAAKSVAIQTDGKIVVAGYSNNYGFGSDPDNAYDVALVRYTNDGKLDATFGNNGKVTTSVKSFDYGNAMVIQSDGKIVVAGSSSNDFYADILLVRYNTNGSLDNTFGNNGKVLTNYDDADFGINTDNEAYGLALQPNGKIIVSGVTTDDLGFDVYIALLRYNTDGSLDNSFGDSGKASRFDFSPALANSAAVQPDGKIVIAAQGYSDDNSYNRFALTARYNTDGTPDKTYGTRGFAAVGGYYRDYESELLSIALQPDGKILSAGFTSYGRSDAGVARFKTNGKRDSTFGNNGLTFFKSDELVSYVPSYPLAMQQDGKIIVGGTFKKGFELVRLLNDEASSKTNNNLSVRLYPNPAADKIIIEGLNKNLPFAITVTDVSGNIIKAEKKLSGDNTVDVSRLKTGRYIAVISQNNKTASAKFIKQ